MPEPKSYEAACETDFQRGVSDGKTDFAKKWMESPQVSVEARLGILRLEHERLKLKDRYFAEGVPIRDPRELEGRVCAPMCSKHERCLARKYEARRLHKRQRPPAREAFEGSDVV